MTPTLVLGFLLLLQNAVSIDGKFLKRSDLPDDFRFPLLELDVAVLRLNVENNSDQAWTIKPEEVEVTDPKNKPLAKALPTEITPKIMDSKQFKRSNRNVHGSIGTGYPAGIYGPYGPPPRVPITTIPDAGPGSVSVDTAGKIRAVLETHELKTTTLAPGEKLEALIYLKSKKDASELSGSTIRVADKTIKIF